MDFGARKLAVDPEAPCVIIGEIGVNHNNDLDLMRRLIEEGARAGLDVLKFQFFSAEGVASQFAASAAYQAAGGDADGQLALLRDLELSEDALMKARDHCRALGVGFLCAVFDPPSAAFVAGPLARQSVKIASSEIGNEPFLAEFARLFDGLILSSGASELSETARGVETLRGQPAPNDQREIALLHCVSEYPAPPEDLNLRAMTGLAAALDIPVGFSDHSVGVVAGVAAAALGARVLEKHDTLDKSPPGAGPQGPRRHSRDHRLCARGAQNGGGARRRTQTPGAKRSAQSTPDPQGSGLRLAGAPRGSRADARDARRQAPAARRRRRAKRSGEGAGPSVDHREGHGRADQVVRLQELK